MTKYPLFLKRFPQTLKNEPLKKHTTFRIGGPADLFFVANSSSDLIRAVRFAKKLKINFLVLGIGSNVLISDYGFRGLIIKNKSQNIKINKNEINVDSGVLLSVLIKNALEKNLNLSFLSGIPSTVGGAIFGNAGLPNKAIGDVVKKVIVLNEGGEREVFGKNILKFNYRKSNLQKKYLIISAVLSPEKLAKDKILEELTKLDAKRTAKNLPGFGAGSIFKNAKVTQIKNKKVQTELTELFGKIVPAGYLLEKSGAKKVKSKNVFVWEKHANIIINNGKASATEVKEAMENCRTLVYNKYKVKLEPEVRLIGFKLSK